MFIKLRQLNFFYIFIQKNRNIKTEIIYFENFFEVYL